MKYCTRCIIPDTRPGVRIGEDGVCSACLAYGEKATIDWAARRAELEELVRSVKKLGRRYDCVVPVSGGKDSTWQVATCLALGLHPLAVSWKPPLRTGIGERNLANLVSLGVDHIDFQVNPKAEKKFLYQALVRYGATAIPMHMAMFNIPLTIAVKFNIPLVVWGENSADEYAGTGERSRGAEMTSEWLKCFGVTHGTTAADWVSAELSREELTPYFGPTGKELAAHDTRAIFLGYYLGWDPDKIFTIAKQHGFRERPEGPKTGYYAFADIDDTFISIHHYLKWYKFGFTRLFDNLSLEIRNGRMTRERAIAVVREKGSQRPREDIAAFCAFVGITKKEFFDIIETFRNRDIWEQRAGVWIIRDFLISGWTWDDSRP